MTIADNEAAVWQTFDDAGWLATAVAKTRSAKVFLVKPGQVTVNGAISVGYEIKYQDADLPTLKEGDAISVDGAKYKVRETPTVSAMPGESHTGFFKRVTLTKL